MGVRASTSLAGSSASSMAIFIQMLGQRQLHQDAVHRCVGGFSSRTLASKVSWEVSAGKPHMHRLEAQRLGGIRAVGQRREERADVGVAGAVRARDHDRRGRQVQRPPCPRASRQPSAPSRTTAPRRKCGRGRRAAAPDRRVPSRRAPRRPLPLHQSTAVEQRRPRGRAPTWPGSSSTGTSRGSAGEEPRDRGPSARRRGGRSRSSAPGRRRRRARRRGPGRRAPRRAGSRSSAPRPDARR